MEKITKAEKKRISLRLEFRKRVIGYIVAAFGLVAGLAWNEAIKALIDYFFPVSQGGLLAKLMYAVLMTFVLVLVTVQITRFLVEEEDDGKGVN